MKASSAASQSPAATGSSLLPLAKPWSSFYPILALLAMVQSQTVAATTTNATWNGGGGGSNGWNNTANWAGSLQPDGAGTSIVHFAGSTSLSPNNDYGAFTQFNQLLFDAGASSFTLGGASIKITGKIENSSTNLQTYNMTSLVLNGLNGGINGSTAGISELDPTTGDLTINNNIILDNNVEVDVYGSNILTLTGAMQDGSGSSGKLVMKGTATVIFNGANTYTAGTFVNNGQLQFGSSGSASGTLTLGDTGGSNSPSIAINPTTGGKTVSNAITVRSGSSGTKSLIGLNTSGTNTFSGAVTLNTGVSASSAGGTGILDFTGAFAGNSNTLTATGGTVHLSGSGDNVALAATVNSGATLVLNKTSTSGVHALGNSSMINSGATLRLGGSGGDQIFNSAGVTVNGTFDLNALSETVDALNGTSSGVVTNNATGTSTLITGGNNGGGTYSGVLQDGGSGKILALSKQGSGNLNLSGANTYSGGTTFGAGNLWGTVSLGSSSIGGPGTITSGPLGTGLLTINGSNSANNIIQSTDSTTRTLSNAITFLGSNVNTTLGGTGDLILDGTINLAGGTRTFTVNNTNTTFSGVVSGNAGSGLTKGGAGTLILSGNNSYSGTTTINAGVVNIRHANALGSTALGTSVAAGASLQLQGVISVGAEALSLTGNTASPFNGTDLTGALRNISDANTYGGAITLASQAAIGADAGSLSLTNTINNGGFRLIVVGAGDISSSNSISGAGDLLKQDAGTLTLTGNNTFGTATNAVFFDKGTIKVGTGGTVGTTNGTSTGWINMGASVAGRNGDSNLLARDAGVTIANPIDSRYYATDVPGTQTIGGLNATGTTNFTGTLALHDNVSLTAAGGGTVVFSGQIQPGSLSGANNQTTGQSLVGGIGGGVTKIGNGTVILTNANTYTGATTVSAGTLNVSGSIAGTSNVAVNGGGTLLLGASNVINNAATVGLGTVGLGGGTFNTGGFSEGDVTTNGLGALTLSVSSTLDFGAGTGSQLWFSGVAGHTASTILSILNWSGTAFQAGGATDDRLIFAGSASTFTSVFNQADVSFNGTFGYSAIQFDGGHFEVVPVPEPTSVATVMGLLGLIGWRERRKGLQARQGERRDSALLMPLVH